MPIKTYHNYLEVEVEGALLEVAYEDHNEDHKLEVPDMTAQVCLHRTYENIAQ